MPETPIGQRLKILIDSLKLDVRTFSQRIDVAETTTRNYLNRGTKPGTEYLEKVYNAFNEANMHWLLTGKGEPLLSTNENNQTTAHAEKFFRSPVVGTNHGTAYQENNATPAAGDVENLRTKLALVEQENEHLKVQLAMKDALLTSKEETLALLRITYNRPN